MASAAPRRCGTRKAGCAWTTGNWRPPCRRVQELWNQVETDNINALTDFAGYKSDFLRLFGFEVEGVDYEAPVNPHAHIDGLA